MCETFPFTCACPTPPPPPPSQVVYDFALKFPDIPARFELVSSYPRRTLVVEEGGGPTLEELGLGHSCVLFVRDATEEEEEE